MKGHKKHKHHPHDTKAAMPEFNAGHWEKTLPEVEMADVKYSSEMNQAEEYKESVDKLNRYVKSHRAKH